MFRILICFTSVFFSLISSGQIVSNNERANQVVKEYFANLSLDSIVTNRLFLERIITSLDNNSTDSSYSVNYNCIYKTDTLFTIHFDLDKYFHIQNTVAVENVTSTLIDWSNEFQGRFRFSYDSVKTYLNSHRFSEKSSYSIFLMFDPLPKIQVLNGNIFRQVNYYWVAEESSQPESTKSGATFTNVLRVTRFSVDTGKQTITYSQ